MKVWLTFGKQKENRKKRNSERKEENSRRSNLSQSFLTFPHLKYLTVQNKIIQQTFVCKCVYILRYADLENTFLTVLLCKNKSISSHTEYLNIEYKMAKGRLTLFSLLKKEIFKKKCCALVFNKSLTLVEFPQLILI